MIFFCIYTKTLFMNQKRWTSDCISTAEDALYLIILLIHHGDFTSRGYWEAAWIT